MSNTINISPAAYDAGAADHAGATSPAKPAAAGTAPPATVSDVAGAEQVSLSSDAAAGTQLLDAARNAEGVDPATVQKVKTAIQNGTYDVSPDKLAQSIIGAMKEMT